MEEMKLPYRERAKRKQIAEKLTSYALNVNHRDGQHKARLFKAKLGITKENQEIIELALLKAVMVKEAVYTQRSEYGDKYVIDFLLTTSEGSSKIRSAWIIRFGENYPRLTSVYPID